MIDGIIAELQHDGWITELIRSNGGVACVKVTKHIYAFCGEASSEVRSAIFDAFVSFDRDAMLITVDSLVDNVLIPMDDNPEFIQEMMATLSRHAAFYRNKFMTRLQLIKLEQLPHPVVFTTEIT